MNGRVPSSATRRGGLLTFNNRKRLERELDYCKRSLRGEVVIPGRPTDGDVSRKVGRVNKFMDPRVVENRGYLKKKIARLEAALRDGTPRPLNRMQKQRLDKQLKEDEEWLRQNLTPRRIYMAPHGTQDYRQALKRVGYENKPEFQARIQRWKTAKRTREPDSPDCANVESIRPD